MLLNKFARMKSGHDGDFYHHRSEMGETFTDKSRNNSCLFFRATFNSIKKHILKGTSDTIY